MFNVKCFIVVIFILSNIQIALADKELEKKLEAIDSLNGKGGIFHSRVLADSNQKTTSRKSSTNFLTNFFRGFWEDDINDSVNPQVKKSDRCVLKTEQDTSSWQATQVLIIGDTSKNKAEIILKKSDTGQRVYFYTKNKQEQRMSVVQVNGLTVLSVGEVRYKLQFKNRKYTAVKQ